MIDVHEATAGPATRGFSPRLGLSAWRNVSPRIIGAAALLGVGLFAYQVIVRMAFSMPIAIYALMLIRCELTAFALVACLVVADRVVGSDDERRLPYLVAIVVGSMLGALLAWMLYYIFGTPGPPGSNRFSFVLYIQLEFMLLGAAAAFAWLDHRRARRARARMHASQLARVQAAKRTLEARLQAMQARVEPQFLFDTLGKVKQLYERDAELAERVLDELIAYLRAAMPRMRDTSSTIAQEVDLVRAWLSIARTGANVPFHFTIEVADDAHDARLPPMMLLPLAERMLAGGAATRIALAITTESDRLHVRLAADRSPPVGDDKTIAALRERLGALFGDQAKLEIAGSEARLDIPFEATGFEAAAPVPA